MPEEPRHLSVEVPSEAGWRRVFEHDPEIRARVERMLATYLETSVVGIGTTARVFSELPERIRGTWCAKDVHTVDVMRGQNAPHEEFRLQHDAYRALESAQASGGAVARVPAPIAYVEVEHGGAYRQLIVMERIVGQTLLRTLAHAIIANDARYADLRPELLQLRDEVIEDALVLRLGLRGQSTAAKLHAIVVAAARTGFRLPRTTADRVDHTLRVLHATGIQGNLSLLVQPSATMRSYVPTQASAIGDEDPEILPEDRVRQQPLLPRMPIS